VAPIADGEVVSRVLAGDAGAYALLFQKYGRVVHALALAQTVKQGAAVEVVRKAFEKAYADLDRIPPGATFRQFLLAAAAEAAAEWVRANGRSSETLRLGAREARRAGGNLELRRVLADLKGEEAAGVLLEAAAKLPPNYQMPFLLRHLEGMSHGEIAEATGIAAAEVPTALEGGRRLLERELKHALEAAG
jgi:RNA polymerase sigma-70 factor (ECF subfamily)